MRWIALSTICVVVGSSNVTDILNTCRDIKIKERQSKSGIYNRTNQNGEIYEVYCEYEDFTGYTFIAMDTVVDIDIENLYTNRSFAVIRHLDTYSKQKEVKVEQLSIYSEQANLNFFYNTNPGYANPKFTSNSALKYLYLGFLPINIAKKRTTQGYKASGQDFTFVNCDANANSYIAFYLTQDREQVRLLNPDNASEFMKGWITNSVDLDHSKYMDQRFYGVIEMHMGGCGGHLTSNEFDNILAAMGIPFDIPPGPCYGVNPCLHNGKCVEIGSSFKCECPNGYSGDRCQHRICMCPCSAVGPNKWGFLKDLNLTVDELKEIMSEDLKKLTNELKISKNTTSAYYRLKNSVQNKHKSEISFGYVGVTLLCITIVIIVLIDLSRCLQN